MITDTTAIPDIEPLEFNAGDIVRWTRDLGSEFAAYTLTYYLAGPQTYPITTSRSGSIFTATISASDSASYPPDDYTLKGLASSGTTRLSVYDGKCKVLIDPANTPAGYDARSHAKKCLDAIEDVIEIRATRPEAQYQIDGIGRHYIYKTDKELIDLRQFYQAEYRQELQADAVRRGEVGIRNIGVRFNRAG